MKHITAVLNIYLLFQERLCSLMLVVLGVAMTILILLQIFFRFVIYVPFPWSEECARYLMIWMGMLGSVVALQKGRHIGVTVLVEKLWAPLQKVSALFMRTVSIGLLAVFLKQGIGFAIFNRDQLSPAMEISMLIPYIAVPAGALMMILVIAGDILNVFFAEETFLK